jgi:hypothetical protein
MSRDLEEGRFVCESKTVAYLRLYFVMSMLESEGCNSDLATMDCFRVGWSSREARPFHAMKC